MSSESRLREAEKQVRIVAEKEEDPEGEFEEVAERINSLIDRVESDE